MLAVTICSTKSYCYASYAQSRRLQGMLTGEPAGHVIMVGDQSEEFARSVGHFEEIMPAGWSVMSFKLEGLAETKNYKPPVQRVISQMRTVAFSAARQLDAEACLSLDSDVLPPANALRAMRQSLALFDGYYSVATCPYPSQAGRLFLGGRGTPENPILPDVYEDERKLPPELEARLKARQEEAKAEGFAVTPKWRAEGQALRQKIQKCEAIGNVWQLNSVRFRRRGWLDNAYPGIGRGAIVPIDWCGFGCTLMNREALDNAQFDGYCGGGTEDLYIVFKRWHRQGLRICAITHCPADHVSRERDGRGRQVPGRYVLQQTYHESAGECAGHLRVHFRPFYDSSVGEAPVVPRARKRAPKRRKSVVPESPIAESAEK